MLKLYVYVETATLQFFQMPTRCNAYILTVVGPKCKVSFDVPNFLVSLLGFTKTIIYGVNSILVHCTIIHSSYMRGVQAPVAYNFFPDAAPEQKILKAPHN